MIDLRYTNAPAFNAEQTEPSRSLGGWISSSILPNSGSDGVFQSVGLFSLCGRTETNIAIAVKGEDTETTIYLSITGSALFDFFVGTGEIRKQEATATDKIDKYYTRQSINNATFRPQIDYVAIDGAVPINLTLLDGWAVLWLSRRWKEAPIEIDELEEETVNIQISREAIVPPPVSTE